MGCQLEFEWYFAYSGRSQDHKPEFLLLKTLHILISDSLVNFEQQKCLFCLVESVRGVDTPYIFYSNHIRKSPPKMAFGVICFISIYDILEITLNLIQNYTTNLLKLVSTTCHINYCIAGTTICQACLCLLLVVISVTYAFNLKSPISSIL